MLVRSQNLAASGVACEYYGRGGLKRETLYQNGVKEGLEKSYYEDGTLEYEINFKNGKGREDGIEKRYYKNGTLKSESFYKNGDKDGVETEYYASGVLRHRVTYDYGEKEGVESWYDEDGTETDQYNHGGPVGNALKTSLMSTTYIPEAITGVTALVVSSPTLTTLAAGEAQSEVLFFVQINMDSLIRDIATGKGDTIDALAVLMDLDDSKAFGETLQANFETIFPDADFDYHHVAYTIETLS